MVSQLEKVIDEPSAAPPPADSTILLKCLERRSLEMQIRQRLGDMIQELELTATSQGRVLHGRVRSYYAKQLAQQHAMQGSHQAIAVNDIIVGLGARYDDWLPP